MPKIGQTGIRIVKDTHGVPIAIGDSVKMTSKGYTNEGTVKEVSPANLKSEEFFASIDICRVCWLGAMRWHPWAVANLLEITSKGKK